jgi:hypothetical protein
MISRNVFSRYSATEVLDDPWIKKYISKKVHDKNE